MSERGGGVLRVVLDFNDSQEVVGVEILRLSMRSADLNLSALQYEAV